MREHEGILSVIGNTPLIRLTRALGDVPFRLYAKLESLNPGGSMKDRPAYSIIRRGFETGDIRPGTVVIESSSGNMGIGLAQACAYFKLRLICVVDPKATMQNIQLMRSYGAEVDMVTEPDPQTGEFLQARINRVQELLLTTENSFWPDQYSNGYNPIAHHDTMREIDEALGGEVDYIFCATSTCGTIRGCAEYLREHGLPAKAIAVDAVGSVIFGGEKAKRLIPGHGAAIRPRLYQPDLASQHVLVSDLDCVVGCRRLVRSEAVLVGGSSGAVLMAVDRMKERIPPGSNCVAIFADRGERYLDTIYSDAWVGEHFGDVSHLWEKSAEDHRWLAVTY
ncbi:MAG TPA: 2,3-diaminopropionate biosynthesis protein SbnA [Pyrinomonadaceae bacterium]|jgi:cysteine synthase A|nr:2,3-diaminopropionate biosynthesis protein SbnA [Pyrinomonadaceae bacterium]